MSESSIVPSDCFETNASTQNKLTVKNLNVQRNTTALITRCDSLNVDASLIIGTTDAKIKSFDSIPINLDISVSDPNLNLSLNDNLSKYVPLTTTVFLQAEIYLGNPPALTGPSLIAQIDTKYAPKTQQTFYGDLPLYNANPPFPFTSQVALKLDTNGQITLSFLGGTIGYLKIPIQFSYLL